MWNMSESFSCATHFVDAPEQCESENGCDRVYDTTCIHRSIRCKRAVLRHAGKFGKDHWIAREPDINVRMSCAITQIAFEVVCLMCRVRERVLRVRGIAGM